jgi:plastocyanin
MKKISLVLGFSCVAALAACGDDTAPEPDMSANKSDMPQSNADMAGFQLVESCAFGDYIDDSSMSGPIAVAPWDESLGKKCIRIHVGQTVTWAASVDHPLESTSGTKPTPLSAIGATTPQSIMFNAVGVYGFQCQVHTSLMHGAIWVTP